MRSPPWVLTRPCAPQRAPYQGGVGSAGGRDLCAMPAVARAGWPSCACIEAWQNETPAAGSSQAKNPQRGPITDFKLWAKCFATLAGVVVAVYPEKATHMMAYLRLIAKASLNYENEAWVAYDSIQEISSQPQVLGLGLHRSYDV